MTSFLLQSAQQSHLITTLIIAIPFCTAQPSRAAHAAFSPNQHSVYLTASDVSGMLRVLNAETSEIRDLTFPEIAQAPGKPEIRAISPGKDGGFWLLTKKVLWRWDGGKASAQKVADAPEGVTFEDVAAQREGEGSLVITGRLARQDEWGRTGRLFLKRDAQGPLLKVFVRRLDEIECPVYLDDGSLLFGAEGDLWHGKVDFEPGARGARGLSLCATGDARDLRRYSHANRCVPDRGEPGHDLCACEPHGRQRLGKSDPAPAPTAA